MGPPPRGSDSVGLEWGVRVCISNQFRGDSHFEDHCVRLISARPSPDSTQHGAGAWHHSHPMSPARGSQEPVLAGDCCVAWWAGPPYLLSQQRLISVPGLAHRPLPFCHSSPNQLYVLSPWLQRGTQTWTEFGGSLPLGEKELFRSSSLCLFPRTQLRQPFRPLPGPLPTFTPGWPRSSQGHPLASLKPQPFPHIPFTMHVPHRP